MRIQFLASEIWFVLIGFFFTTSTLHVYRIPHYIEYHKFNYSKNIFNQDTNTYADVFIITVQRL